MDHEILPSEVIWISREIVGDRRRSLFIVTYRAISWTIYVYIPLGSGVRGTSELSVMDTYIRGDRSISRFSNILL